MTRFTHLHVRSHYSFGDGFASPQALAKRARTLGYDALALTDRHNLHAAVKFSRACRSAGLKPILGCEVHLDFGLGEGRGEGPATLVLLARDEEGYHNLCRILSQSEREAGPRGPRVSRAMIEKQRKGLSALSGGVDGILHRAAARGDQAGVRSLAQELAGLLEPGAFYVEIQPDEEVGAAARASLEECARNLALPTLAARTTTYAAPEDRAWHAAALSLDRNAPHPEGGGGSHLAAMDEMQKAFQGRETLLQAAWDLGERCDVDLAAPKPFVLPGPPQAEARRILETKAREGLRKSLGSQTSGSGPDGVCVFEGPVENRLRSELEGVQEAGFENYFLAAERIARLAEERGILLGPGRGSAVGSLLAYALGLSRINPLDHGLYFERFLNPARKAPPDIDIDVEHDRREELLALLTREFGEHKLAGLVTFSTLRARAALREAARLLKIPDAEAEDILKRVPLGSDSLSGSLLKGPLAGALAKRPDLFRLAAGLEGLPRHASVHASGFVLGPRPLDEILPLSKAASGEMVTQYDMHDVEAAGLIKVDLLGLTTLTLIKKVLSHVRATGVQVDLDAISREDPDTLELLSRGDTLGVFQMDGVGIRDLARKLRPRNLSDIAVLIALIRPGPQDQIEGYLAKRRGQAPVSYPHPSLEPLLRETLGEIVYQEQVMGVAHVMGMLSLREADLLRVAMKSKDGTVLDPLRDRFLRGARSHGLGESEAADLYALLVNFAQFGFNKSHAVAYAWLAYQTAYLKAHYPCEFTAALLDLHAGEHDKLGEYIEDARRRGLRVLGPSVLRSTSDFAPLKGGVRYGLKAVKHVGKTAADELGLALERSGGSPQGVFTLLKHADPQRLPKRAVEALVRAGAFDGLGGRDRPQLAANMEELWRLASGSGGGKGGAQETLFSQSGRGEDEELEALGFRWKAPGEAQGPRLSDEKELLGAYFSGHPMADMEGDLRWFATHRVADLREVRPGNPVRVAGVLSGLRIAELPGRPGEFARFRLEDGSGSLDLVCWPESLVVSRAAFAYGGVLLAQGQLEAREDRLELNAAWVVPLREAWTRCVRALEIRVVRRGADASVLERLREILARHPGEAKVAFRIPSPHVGDVLLSAGPQGVQPGSALMDDLAAWVQPGDVALEWGPPGV